MSDLNKSLNIKTQPASEPVDLQELKDFARIDSSDEDTLLNTFLKAAREGAEKYTGRAFITQTWEIQIDSWPSSVLELSMPPLQSVTEVRTFDDEGTPTVFDSGNYLVNIKSTPGTIYTPNESPIPTRKYAGIEVEYIAGYGDTKADVPDSIRLAIMQWAADMYETRVITDKPPKNVQSMLTPFIVFYL